MPLPRLLKCIVYVFSKETSEGLGINRPRVYKLPEMWHKKLSSLHLFFPTLRPTKLTWRSFYFDFYCWGSRFRQVMTTQLPPLKTFLTVTLNVILASKRNVVTESLQLNFSIESRFGIIQTFLFVQVDVVQSSLNVVLASLNVVLASLNVILSSYLFFFKFSCIA